MRSKYLLPDPLECTQRPAAGKAGRCVAQAKAFEICKLQEGRAFLRCMQREIGESPMGH